MEGWGENIFNAAESSHISMFFNPDSTGVLQRIDDLLLHIGDDLHSRHLVFREGMKKAAHSRDLVDITLWIEEGNGKVVSEVITLPRQIFEPDTKRYNKLVEYIAVCLNIRGETLGIRQVGMESSGGMDIDRLLGDVRGYFEREFFITLLDANSGRVIRWQRGRIEQGDIRIGQVRAGRYDHGRSVGLVVTGTDIKTVALENGNIVYRKEIAIEEERPLEEMLEECIIEASERAGISQDEDIYIGVPGPVDPWGNIVRIPRTKGVTRESLEALQNRYPKIRFINDGNVEAVYHKIVWAGDIATDQPTVVLVLRRGIGFGILEEGESLSWVGAPTETHFRVNFSDDASFCNCGMKGCLELPARWVVDRFIRLTSENHIELPSDFREMVRDEREDRDLLAMDIGALLKREGEAGRIATDVFMEYGENLSTLFGELARLMEVSVFWVVLSGGMVQQRGEREAIIRGIARGIDDKFSGLRIEILSRIEEVGEWEDIIRYERIPERWQGAVGAALCALQDKQMRLRMEPATRMMMEEVSDTILSDIADIFCTGRKLSSRTTIGIAGSSGGGKTHFARRSRDGLEELGSRSGYLNGLKVETITMDDYLIPKEKRERGGIRAKYSLKRLWEDIMAIQDGAAICHPIFDQVSRVRYSRIGQFLDGKSAMLGHRLSERNTELFRRINRLTEWSGEAGIKLKPDMNTIVIVDGILALDDPVINKLYYDHRIFVHAPWIWRLCAAISRAQEEKWYSGADTADIIEKFVFKRPEEEAIINVTYLDADVMIENDHYEKKVDLDLKDLLGEVCPRLNKDYHAQYYIIYSIMKDHGYDARKIFEERLQSIEELIRASRIEDMYEEGSGRRLEEDVCRMVSGEMGSSPK